MATDEVVEAVARAITGAVEAAPEHVIDAESLVRAALGAEPVARAFAAGDGLVERTKALITALHAQEGVYLAPDTLVAFDAANDAADAYYAALEPFAGITEGARDG